ncbi:HD domain-containing phosphohydrolase [Acetobacterium sp.]|uniref:diguanylate cyclase domain-containing protein n=1 Tax=Acetobacterium sp. TaxID=1872094 RepID=UPI002725B715|nr:HD domain-containing phosphohydrolase [Acetobacterium sp.]MDO9492589.1 diguanylate cyclase [Acetobacterium sp.]
MEKYQATINNQIRMTIVGLCLLGTIFVAVYFNYFKGIDVVYTHLFYVVIVMVGLWYKRYVIQLAMFLGLFHIVMDYLSFGAFLLAPILRASILLFVAFGIYFLINQLESSHKNLDRVMKSVGDGIIVVDLEQRVTMLNRVAEELTGWTNDEACGKSFNLVFNLAHENCEYQVPNPVDEALRTDQSTASTNHAVITDRLGNRFNIEDSATPVKDGEGTTTGVVLIFRDISERTAQNEQIEYLSYHDHLTGLYNRRYFEEELKRIDGRRHFPLSIIMGDINNLKMINDAFGHLAGDELIFASGKIIKKFCRPNDVAARWGGDEFVLLLPNTDEEATAKIVERMNQAVALAPVDRGVLSIAFGWDTKKNLSEDVMVVFKNAENYMYKHKLLMKPQVRDDAIRTILASLYLKNGIEKNHGESVSRYARLIAEEMQLSNREIETLHRVAQLHDIGKVTLNPGVLDKKGSLTADEWVAIKRHPEIGYHITNTSADTAEIALAILSHHEWWDGSGYPKRLTGQKIPLLSRIIAIAEAYDAMLTDRPYQPAMDQSQAVQAIVHGAGSQFDPNIAAVFVNRVIGN